MASPMPILASEVSAAKLLDMSRTEFRALVDGGHLPHGREIAPGVVRWDVEDLRRICRGDAAESLSDIKW